MPRARTPARRNPLFFCCFCCCFFFALDTRHPTLDTCKAAEARTAAPADNLTVANASFEADHYAQVPGYARHNGGTITGWTWRGSVGLNPTWRAPAQQRGPMHAFTDNGLIPQGKQAAFIHNAGRLSQKIPGFRKGRRYVVTYRENARHNNAPKRNPRLKVTLGGEVIVSAHAVPPVEEIGRHTLPYHAVTSTPFTAGADGTFELVFQATHTDRVAVLVDDVRIVEAE